MRSRSSLSMIVEAVRVVEVESKRVDTFGSDSTRVLLDKLGVDNISKNIFQALDSDISFHAELL